MTFEQKLAGAKDEILAFQTSKVWELWLEHAKRMQESYAHDSIHKAKIEDREHARMAWLAFQEFQNIPFVLVRKVEAISQDEAPKD